MTNGPLAASFRDPSGFLFVRDGVLYRQVNVGFRSSYDLLMQSGCYDALREARLLVGHDEMGRDLALTDEAYQVLKPEPLPFLSYPYEWCLSQLRDAALTTLAIQKVALKFGMALKDCSAYNIQFVHGRPTLIDTLSLERYPEGQPWIAYRQFCQHFLAPLALMSYQDVRLSQLLRVHLDGIPLDLASALLPLRARANPSLLCHLVLHAASQRRFAEASIPRARPRLMTRHALLGLIETLESSVTHLRWRAWTQGWATYYKATSYSPSAMQHKGRIVEQYLDHIRPKTLWDLGANTGTFSRLASERGVFTVAFDSDYAAVEQHYQECVQQHDPNRLPLVCDVTNPSPGIGWGLEEGRSWFERGPADAVLVLALVHHLAITHNLPFKHIADVLCRIASWAIVEFVPKDDPQVQQLLRSKEGIFPGYTREAFEQMFQRAFDIRSTITIQGTQRVLYLLQRKPVK